MNVFILNTGRCGSTTIIRACQHMTNFTASHESRSKFLSTARLDYPDQHIEADNRLTWFLGQLDQKYGNDAFYVHLLRDRTATASSYAKRWGNGLTIVQAFSESVLMHGTKEKTDIERLQISSDYYDATNANIELFLKDKDKKMLIHLEDIETGFRNLWAALDAEGDLSAAIATLNQRHNSTESPTKNRAAFTPHRRERSRWEKLKLRFISKRALFWTNFYFKEVRKE